VGHSQKIALHRQLADLLQQLGLAIVSVAIDTELRLERP